MRNDLGIGFYNENAEQMAFENNNIDRNKVHTYTLPLVEEAKKLLKRDVLNILDIGTGSGIDASFFAKTLGHCVVGVEPAKDFLKKAEDDFSHPRISFINDELPHLHKVQALRQKFDIILLTSVWQYVSPEDRVNALSAIISFCHKDSLVIMQYPYPPSREYQYKITMEEFESDIITANEHSNSDLKFQIADVKLNPDTRGRKAINGENLIFKCICIKLCSTKI